MRYIRLITYEKLLEKDSETWYNIVREYGPQGNINSEPVKNKTYSNDFIYFSKKNIHVYQIYLKRDLLEKEIKQITSFWSSYYFNKFDIEVTQTLIKYPDDPLNVFIEEEKFKEIALLLSKNKHKDYIKTKLNQGWRYGTEYSETEKTDPKLLPWESLNDTFKDINYELPDQFLKILNDIGYEIVKKQN